MEKFLYSELLFLTRQNASQLKGTMID